MRYVLLILCMFLCKNVQASPILSTTALFESVVLTHFEQIKTCGGIKRIPSLTLQRNEAIGCFLAQQRFWPTRQEYWARLFAFILSEGAGLPSGNPDDPSYGVANVHYPSGREAANFWKIDHPKGKTVFIEKLRYDSKFNIMIAAGELALKETRSGGDWIWAIGQTKCGIRRFQEILDKLGNRPITDLRFIRIYLKSLSEIQCLEERLFTDTYVQCGCMPVRDEEKQPLSLLPSYLTIIRALSPSTTSTTVANSR